MAKTPRQAQPRGELITITPDRRERWIKRRNDIGLDQEQLADKIGTSQGTISNVERGTQKQIRKPLFAKWERVMSGDSDGDDDEMYVQAVDKLSKLDTDRIRFVLEMTERFAALNPRQAPAGASGHDGEPPEAVTPSAPPSAPDHRPPSRRRRPRRT